MIVVKLFGGLGNQMFQYAFGLSLAQRHNVPLLYDTRWFNEVHDVNLITPRDFSLGCFRINSDLWRVSDDPIFFPGESFSSKLRHKLLRLGGLRALLYENAPGYDERIVDRSRPFSYAIGHWQSFRYFQSIDYLVRQEFNFCEIACSEWSDLAGASSTVAVHVRRGDYVENLTTKSIHGSVSLAYYHKAVGFLQQRLGKALNFLVFSDDPDWCEVNMRWIDNVRICRTIAYPHWYDMYLMSKCQHHIIANSSYSWWGAWLAAHEKQLVIAPAEWFKGIPTKSLQLTPASWQLL